MKTITSAFIRRVELKSGKRWRGVLKFTDENDQSRQITKTFPSSVKTKTQANAALVAWREEVEAEDAAPDASLSVGAYARAYVEGLERGNTVEPSTLKGYETLVKHIEDEFAGVKLRDLTTKKVERWRNRMIDAGLSPVTVTKHLRFLNMVVSHAVEVHDLEWNPCKAVKAPKKSQVEPASLDPAAVRKLAKLLEESEPTPLITSAAIGLYAGMREGEVCGLRWQDIDLENQTINVRRAIGIGAGGAYEKTPKNESSRRSIPMPSALVTMLKRRRAVQHAEWAEMRMKLGAPTTDEDYSTLFVTGTVDGAHAAPAVISRAWKSFAENNGLRDTKGERAVFHCLRHSYASVLISDGYEAVTVAKLLGHSRPSMTLDVYAAAFEARKQAAAKSIGDAIGAAIAQPEPAEVLVFGKAANE